MLRGFAELPVAHLGFNSVIPFANDPWIALLSDLSALPITALYWLILCGGIFLLPNSLSAIIAALAVVIIFGMDRALLGLAAWLPLTITLIERYQRRSERALLIILLFLGMRLAYSSGPLITVEILLIAWVVTVRYRADTSIRTASAALALALGVLCSVHAIPGLPAFDYPTGPAVVATVVPDDGLPGVLQPLIGPAFPLQVIDQTALREIVLCPFIISFALLILTASRSRAAWTTFGIVALDLFQSPQMQSISPLASLARMLPGAFLYPLSVIVVSGLLWRLLSNIQPLRTMVLGLLAVSASLISTALHTSDKNHRLYSDAMWADIQGRFSPAQIASPSLAVIQRGQPFISSSSNDDWGRCNVSIKVHTGEITTSSDVASIVSDDDSHTRVSLGQEIGNSFTVCFAARPARAIWLDPGEYHTDFPQNFSVHASTAGAQLRTYEPWLGPVQETKTQHLPFYGPQSTVQIAVPSELSAGGCLDIRLTKRNRAFDWSIAELRCLD